MKNRLKEEEEGIPTRKASWRSTMAATLEPMTRTALTRKRAMMGTIECPVKVGFWECEKNPPIVAVNGEIQKFDRAMLIPSKILQGREEERRGKQEGYQ